MVQTNVHDPGRTERIGPASIKILIMDTEFFKYYSESTLVKYVGHQVEWIDLFNKVRSGILTMHGRRAVLPESGGVYAATVLVKLPSKKS